MLMNSMVNFPHRIHNPGLYLWLLYSIVTSSSCDATNGDSYKAIKLKQAELKNNCHVLRDHSKWILYTFHLCSLLLLWLWIDPASCSSQQLKVNLFKPVIDLQFSTYGGNQVMIKCVRIFGCHFIDSPRGLTPVIDELLFKYVEFNC